MDVDDFPDSGARRLISTAGGQKNDADAFAAAAADDDAKEEKKKKRVFGEKLWHLQNFLLDMGRR